MIRYHLRKIRTFATPSTSQHIPASPHLLPTFEQQDLGPLEKFEYKDRGLFANKQVNKLLKDAKVEQTTPKIGSDIRGIQLSQLDNEQLDQLAYFVAERGVVFFRNQDIKGNVDVLTRIGQYFSPKLHVHQTYGIPKDMPHIHVVTQADYSHDMFEKVTNAVRWHTDVSYELQPPGLTFLAIQDIPIGGGGDTIWSSQYEAYNRLSTTMKQFLETLTATHSAHEQAKFALETELPLRRLPVKNSHPVVRTHPVTGKKALYVNPMFTRYIDGLKQEESQMLLQFLYNHVALGADFQARFKWEKWTVAVWDNRATCHTGIIDYDFVNEKRHAVRVTPQAERPILVK
jgi:sulfonate dioxygenase